MSRKVRVLVADDEERIRFLLEANLESAGYEATLAQSIELTRTGGEVLVFGTLTGGDKGLPYYQLYHKELTIYNPRAALTRDYQRGIELAATGVLDLEPIVTHNLRDFISPELKGYGIEVLRPGEFLRRIRRRT